MATKLASTFSRDHVFPEGGLSTILSPSLCLLTSAWGSLSLCTWGLVLCFSRGHVSLVL